MKLCYGWRMVAAGGSIQFLQAALLHQAFGAYFAVLAEERGWSKTALSGAAVLQPMESALLGPALGWIVDRFGPQGMIRAGIVTFGIDFLYPANGIPISSSSRDAGANGSRNSARGRRR